MRERQFFSFNRRKWAEYEQLVKSKKPVNPDKLADLFLESTDDLSYARTHFPGSRSEEFLNSLATQTHLAIYKTRRNTWKGVRRYWLQDIPLAFYAGRGPTLLAFGFSLLFAAVGLIGVMEDENFFRVLIGDAYADMTEENIAKGNPMAVYGNQPVWETFVRITVNNLIVFTNFFITGMAAGFFTIPLLFMNVAMLGGFFYFMVQRGVAGSFAQALLLHGTIELTVMVFSAGAAFVIARGLLFPGTYTRGAAFRRNFNIAFKMYVGLIPLVVVAGMIEGFITRYYQWSAVFNYSVIGLSAAFLFWYLIYFPRRVARQNPSLHAGSTLS